MRLVLLAIFPAALAAQTLILTGPATISRNTTVSLTLTLAGSAGANLAAFQWSITVAPKTWVAGVTGGPGLPTGKAISCAAICVAADAAPVTVNGVFTDGAVATIVFSVGGMATVGPTHLTLTGMLGANLGAKAVPIASGPVYSFSVK
jgi:hypothetical protein